VNSNSRSWAEKRRFFRVVLIASLVGWAVAVLALLAMGWYVGLGPGEEREVLGLILFLGAAVGIPALLSYPWGHRRANQTHAQADAEPGATPDPARRSAFRGS
jgi:hypothetical protein